MTRSRLRPALTWATAAWTAIAIAVSGAGIPAHAALAGTTGPRLANLEQAGAAQKYLCRSFGSFPAYNARADVARGVFTWPAGRKTVVGDSSGNISWTIDPYREPSWRTWFHGLAWIGSLVESSTRGRTKDRDPRAIDQAVAITADWVRDNPYPWPAGPGAGNGTHTRVDSMACLRAGLLQLGKPVPAWLDASLAQHAGWLRRNTWKDHNVGTEQTLAVLGVGCMLGRRDYITYAAGKLSGDITRVIDAQGANNEQSLGYARHNWDIWGDAEKALSTCGVTTRAAATITARRAALARFLDHATKPDGYLVTIGDTKRERARTGSPAQQWIASDGKSGTPLRERVKVYSAGYVFGRSGWGTTGRAPSQESMYSIHFGPRRLGHGHNDHMSITWHALGREILADPGTGQYREDPWRAYYTGPAAHNQLVVQGMKTSEVTTLTRAQITAKAAYYQLRDSPLKGVSRVRDVIFLSDPDIVLTIDQAASSARRTFIQTWHLPYSQHVTAKNGTAVATTPQVAGKTTMLSLPVPGAGKTRYGHVRGSTRPIAGWQWTDHFTRHSAPVLTAAQTGTSAAIATAFAASGTSDRVAVRASGNARAMTYAFTVGRQSAVVRRAADGTLTRLR